MAGGRFWTTLEERECYRLADEGMKYVLIARKLDRTFGAIHGKLLRRRRKAGILGLPRLHKPGELAGWVRKLCTPGVPDTAVGNILGVSRTAVKHARDRQGIPPGCKMHIRQKKPERASVSLEAKVIRLYAGQSGIGRSDREIARILDIPYWDIRKILNRVDLPALGLRGNYSKNLVTKPTAPKRTKKVAIEAAILILYGEDGCSDNVLAEVLRLKAVSNAGLYRRRLGLPTMSKNFKSSPFDKSRDKTL